jgi:subtilisin-like proprotein convertase family protein
VYTGFARNTSLPCSGTASLRRNFWTSDQTSNIQSVTWLSSGLDLTISFDYKIIDFSSPNPATPNSPNWGEFFVEVSTDGGANYTISAGTINTSNHTPSTSCSNVSYMVPGSSLPEGSSLRVRLRGQRAAGDYWFYIDNVVLMQDGACGSFLHPGRPCDDGNPNTFSDTVDANCDCVGSPMTNPTPCGLNLPIPDNGCGINNSLMLQLPVTGQSDSLGVNVQLQSVDIITTHTFNSDLRIFLVSPNGVQRQLVNGRGSSFDNFGNPANCPNAVLKLQDGATAPSGITGNNVTGVFAPEQTLAGFNDGSNPNGNWTLRICDAAVGDVGALQYVALNFLSCTAPSAIVTTTDDCPNGQFPITVNLTDLGSASSINIATSVGDTLFNIASTGMYSFGPYAFGTPVGITLIHDSNSGCNQFLGTFTSTGSDCPLTNPSACGLNLSIPDNGCASNTFLEKEIAVTGQPNALGINVQFQSVDIITTHTFNGDLRIFLVSPNGVQRELVNRRGSLGDNFGNPANCPNAVLKLRDGAAALTGITGNNVTGVFAPEQTLSGFNDSSNPNGNWTIRICDAVSGDVGTLQYVALNFGCLSPGATVSTTDDCPNGQFTLNVNISNLGGLRDATIATSVGDTLFNVGFIGIFEFGPYAFGTPVSVTLINPSDPSCNLSLGTFTSTGSTCPLNNPSNCGLNLSIPDNGCGSNTYLEKEIGVTGQPNALGINVQLQSVDIITTHTFNGDLRIFLVSPNGVQRELVNRRGSIGDNFGNPANCPNSVLKLRDGAAAPTGITGNNVTGVFAPEQTLAGFNDGSNPNGNWTIRICDAASGDVGALQYVALNFGCIAPEGTSTLVTSCIDNQFFIDIDVTSVGQADTVYIFANSMLVSSTTTIGTTQIGPFDSGSTVAVTLQDSNDASCNSVLTTITYTCPPVNDLCADAIAIDCDMSALGTTVGATGMGQPSTFCGTTPGNLGVWYTFVGSGNMMTVSVCNEGTNFDTKLNIYSGSCGISNLVCVAGNDDTSDPGCQIGAFNRKSKVTIASTAGTTYYVLVSGFGSAAGQLELTLEGCCQTTISCVNGSVSFDGEQSLPIDANASASINPGSCEVSSLVAVPTSIACDQLGMVVPVTINALDNNGDVSASCISNITVMGLPCGWSAPSNGINCPDGSSASSNVSGDAWTVNSNGCYSGNFANDVAAYAKNTLCGNGSITARVTSISGLAWAGIVMRENSMPGSKKAELTTNLSNFARRIFRTITGATALPQQMSAPGRFWLRLTRNNNQFSMHVSADGVTWFFAGAQNIVMPSCIEVGLVVTNYNGSTNIAAMFDNVSISSSMSMNGVVAAQQGSFLGTQEEIHLFPNPSSGVFYTDIQSYLHKSIGLEVRSIDGRLVYMERIDKVEQSILETDISSLPAGFYIVTIKSSDRIDASKPLIIKR